MAYGSHLVETWRRMADDAHEILNGTKSATSRSTNRPDANS